MRVVLGVALVGLVACVGCGREPDAVSHEPPSPNLSQEEAIAAIKKLGGKVEFGSNKAVVFVDLSNTKVTDSGLVHLKGLANLEHLVLFETKVTDAGLVHLEGMTNLENLSLTRTKVTDAGLAHLKGLTKLEKLYLDQTTVTDAGLVHLKGLTNLRQLWLSKTKVTPAGFKKLKQALPKCGISFSY